MIVSSYIDRKYKKDLFLAHHTKCSEAQLHVMTNHSDLPCCIINTFSFIVNFCN